MENYGNIIQTVSIFSIVICAPIGAVLISTFGPLFLTHTPDKKAVEESKEKVKDDEIEIEMKNMEIDGDFSIKKEHHNGPGEG